jgi:hypothetical protein
MHTYKVVRPKLIIDIYIYIEVCYNDCKVPRGTFGYFFLEFFLAVDLWKVFTKIQLIALRVC